MGIHARLLPQRRPERRRGGREGMCERDFASCVKPASGLSRGRWSARHAPWLRGSAAQARPTLGRVGWEGRRRGRQGRGRALVRGCGRAAARGRDTGQRGPLGGRRWRGRRRLRAMDAWCWGRRESGLPSGRPRWPQGRVEAGLRAWGRAAGEGRDRGQGRPPVGRWGRGAGRPRAVDAGCRSAAPGGPEGRPAGAADIACGESGRSNASGGGSSTVWAHASSRTARHRRLLRERADRRVF